MVKALDDTEIDRRFRAHEVTPEQHGQMLALRGAAANLAVMIADATPQGREQSLAITALEEAVFWANAGIARPA